jgi:hypothetical protein
MNNLLPPTKVVKDIINTHGGTYLQYIKPEQYKEDYREIVETAVKKDGLSLQFAKENLNDDEDIVFIAVSQNGFALEFASDTLKNNLRIVKKATDLNPDAMEFASHAAHQHLLQYNTTKEWANSVANGQQPPSSDKTRFSKMSQQLHRQRRNRFSESTVRPLGKKKKRKTKRHSKKRNKINKKK